MNMDGSKPTGFIESDYTNGVEHSMPNDPLRCFYYEHAGSFKSCTEYGYEYTPEEEDDGDYYNPDDEDEHDNDDNYKKQTCSNEDYDSSNYTYTCSYDIWGDLQGCECVLEITCLRDIWVYSSDKSDFWKLFSKNLWTIFVWFSMGDVVNYFGK